MRGRRRWPRAQVSPMRRSAFYWSSKSPRIGFVEKPARLAGGLGLVRLLLGLHVGGPVGQRALRPAARLQHRIDDVLFVAGRADLVELGALDVDAVHVVLFGRGLG